MVHGNCSKLCGCGGVRKATGLTRFDSAWAMDPAYKVEYISEHGQCSSCTRMQIKSIARATIAIVRFNHSTARIWYFCTENRLICSHLRFQLNCLCRSEDLSKWPNTTINRRLSNIQPFSWAYFLASIAYALRGLQDKCRHQRWHTTTRGWNACISPCQLTLVRPHICVPSEAHFL